MTIDPRLNPSAAATTTAQPRKSTPRRWRDALKIAVEPPVLIMLPLGFSAGLPLLLLFGTLSFWLAEVGVARTMIGYFSWVGLSFSLKFFWAPFVDRLPAPFSRHLGKRRAWMLLAQFGIIAGLLGIAATDPTTHLYQTALFALLVAFAAATQDIAIDAFRIESAPPDRQAAMAAMYIAGYRTALLMAGAGALYFADWGGWAVSYSIMAACMMVGVVTVLLAVEPLHQIDRAAIDFEQNIGQGAIGRQLGRSPRWLRTSLFWLWGAVACPIIDFFRRMGLIGLLILVFIGCYRLSDLTLGIMANPFYAALGFSKIEIANIAKSFGLVMTILGGFIGGLLVLRFGVMRVLLLGALLVVCTNLLFVQLARVGPDTTILTLVISADNLSAGIATTAFIAYLSALTNSAYTATQYALFSSLMTLPGKFIGGFSGLAADAWGWEVFFVYSAGLGAPAIILVLILMGVPSGRGR